MGTMNNLIEAAIEAERDGKSEQACRLLQSVLEDHPDLDPVIAATSRLLDAIGQPQEASKLIEQRLERDPTSISALLGLAELAYRRGGPSPARTAYLHLLEMAPDHLGAQAALGSLDLLEGGESSHADGTWPALVLDRVGTSQAKFPMVRSLHHFACTGGTLISKLIASLPGVALISEIHPLNRRSQGFHPTDPLLLLEQSWRPLRTDEIKQAFLADISQAVQICQGDDALLVLRDHSHSDFCRGHEPRQDVLLLDWLRPHYRCHGVVTLRHPLDSWLGLVEAGWHTHFEPSTFREYCRRYHAFLEATGDLPSFHYEDLCRDPLAGLRQLCDLLLLPFHASALEHFGDVNLSGDSGRTDRQIIEIRPRRPIPQPVEQELADPEARSALEQLCGMMGYEP